MRSSKEARGAGLERVVEELLRTSDGRAGGTFDRRAGRTSGVVGSGDKTRAATGTSTMGSVGFPAASLVGMTSVPSGCFAGGAAVACAAEGISHEIQIITARPRTAKERMSPPPHKFMGALFVTDSRCCTVVLSAKDTVAEVRAILPIWREHPALASGAPKLVAGAQFGRARLLTSRFARTLAPPLRQRSLGAR
jgi:hypothetical protein